MHVHVAAMPATAAFTSRTCRFGIDARLQEEMGSHEKHFSSTLDSTEAAMDKSAADFRDLDAATSGLVASATTTGMRLASAHRVSTSAKSTLSILQVRAQRICFAWNDRQYRQS